MIIGMLDKYASDELKSKYLPNLCTLDMMASYCLTEPGSGSDAGSLTTSAKIDGDHYVINGGKEVVNAVADGDIAAQAIHRFISGGQ